jgi:UDP-N-acetyl-D-glucosamine dehydrogenase
MTTLENKIIEKSAIVGIIGLGYVGLPLARAFIAGGYRVLGFDVDQRKVDQLAAGQSYIGHLDAKWIARCIDERSLVATSDLDRLGEPDAILICVPTPLSESRDPDLSYVESTARQISRRLRPGQLIVLESTTYPGTTRDVMLPILSESGLIGGRDFFLAYSPEREDPGNADYTASGIPKVVGGLDPTSLQLAEKLYSNAVTKVIPVASCEVAEACKVLENTYRAVNIALVNELKVLCDTIGIDVWDVIDAAKTKPFGFHAFYPGPGLGGHCIPIDPFYLSWVARKHGTSTRFIELAGEVNASMPQYVLNRLSRALNDCKKPVRGSKVAILGVAYKKDVDDPRESPSFVLMKGLLEQGALVTYNDPHVPHLPKMRHHDLPAMSSSNLTPDYLAEQDCVLIVTDHSKYDYSYIVEHSKLVIDTRNATRGVTKGRDRIVKT